MYRIALLLSVISASLAAVVQYKSCENTNVLCDIQEVRINPCKNPEQGFCRLRRGKTYEIEFDFTPKFDTENGKLNYGIYWATEDVDIPMPLSNTDACEFTKCPLAKNVNKTLVFALPISKKYPLQKFDVKWRLFTGQEKEECCFLTTVKIVR